MSNGVCVRWLHHGEVVRVCWVTGRNKLGHYVTTGLKFKAYTASKVALDDIAHTLQMMTHKNALVYVDVGL